MDMRYQLGLISRIAQMGLKSSALRQDAITHPLMQTVCKAIELSELSAQRQVRHCGIVLSPQRARLLHRDNISMRHITMLSLDDGGARVSTAV